MDNNTRSMKKIKWLTIFILLLVMVFLLRGTIFRATMSYRAVGQRTNYEITNEKLLQIINNKKTTNVNETIKTALSITAGELNFVFTQASANPNTLIDTKSANCIGYSAFCAAVCNHLFQQHENTKMWVATPQIGQIYCLGINIHPYFKSAFFKDHDFVIVKNTVTGAIIAIDAVVYDYFRIKSVKQKELTSICNRFVISQK